MEIEDRSKKGTRVVSIVYGVTELTEAIKVIALMRARVKLM